MIALTVGQGLSGDKCTAGGADRRAGTLRSSGGMDGEGGELGKATDGAPTLGTWRTGDESGPDRLVGGK